MRKIAHFLGVQHNDFSGGDGSGSSSASRDAKHADALQDWVSIPRLPVGADAASGRRLCAIANYAALCKRFSKTIYREYLPDPCMPGVWDCCRCN